MSAAVPGRMSEMIRRVERNTSAPSAARYRVQTGPAMTLVRSSTRTPEAGSSPPGRVRGAAFPTIRWPTSGSPANARPWPWSAPGVQVCGPLPRRRRRRRPVPRSPRAGRSAIAAATAAASSEVPRATRAARRDATGSWRACGPIRRPSAKSATAARNPPRPTPRPRRKKRSLRTAAATWARSRVSRAGASRRCRCRDAAAISAAPTQATAVSSAGKRDDRCPVDPFTSSRTGSGGGLPVPSEDVAVHASPIRSTSRLIVTTPAWQSGERLTGGVRDRTGGLTDRDVGCVVRCGKRRRGEESGVADRSRQSSRSSAFASRSVSAGRLHFVSISLRIDVWSCTTCDT